MLVVVVLGSTSAMFVYCYLAVTPLVVRQLIGGGAPRLGLLTAAGGAGAIVAALLMDSVGRRVGRARLLLVSLATSGLAVIGLGVSHVAILSLAIAFALSASTVTFTANAVLLLQAGSDVAIRGRVLALYNGVFYVLLPVSEALAGWSSDRIGVTAVLASVGTVAAIVAAATYVFNRDFVQGDVDQEGHLSSILRAHVVPAAAGEVHAVLPHQQDVLAETKN
jgi:MFS family permease